MKWYKPSEVAKKRLITNSKNSKSYSSNYIFVINQIKSGRLKAKDYGNKSTKRFLVSEEDIRNYHNNY